MDPSIIVAIITTLGASITTLINSQLRHENTKLKARIKRFELAGSIKPESNIKARIKSLSQGQKVPYNEFVEVSGIIEKNLPSEFKLFVLHGNDNYYVQGQALVQNFGNGEKTWKCRNYFNSSTTVSIVAAGSGGQALFEYYKVLDKGIFSEKNEWTPISKRILPNDVVFYHEVYVECNP